MMNKPDRRQSVRIMLMLKSNPIFGSSSEQAAMRVGGLASSAGRRMREMVKKGLAKAYRPPVEYIPTKKLLNMDDKKIAKLKLSKK
jgi:hypothetical protein